VVFDQFVQGQLSIHAIYEQLSRFLRRFDEWMPAVQAIYRNKS
jgi:hypothetical protein